jgi:DNA-binding response OmpR family regulator
MKNSYYEYDSIERQVCKPDQNGYLPPRPTLHKFNALMETNGARLLVIDDDRISRALLSRQLRAAGYEVFLADDGNAGLEATSKLAPELVLCDWVMPHVDGLAYCRAVRADPVLRDTYIAMLTSRSDSGDQVAGLDAGADDFLFKPVRPPELMARVRAGLRLRQAQRELVMAERRGALVELAATLGHEINNPLTALVGHLELTRQYIDSGDRERLEHHLRQMGRVATRISDVASQLVSLRHPATKPYLGEQTMIDLDGSDGSD